MKSQFWQFLDYSEKKKKNYTIVCSASYWKIKENKTPAASEKEGDGNSSAIWKQ